MSKTLKKQVLVQYQDWLFMYAFILAASLFGHILFLIIMRFDSTANTTFTLGTMMGGILGIIYVFIMQAVQMGVYFNMEVSMGCTRRHFLISEYIVSFAAGLLGLGLVIGIHAAESRWIDRLYPNFPSEINMLPYLLKGGVWAVAGLIITVSFCSAVMMRFKRKAFWVFWTLWMFLCLCVPRIAEAVEEASDSLFGRMGRLAIRIFGLLPIAAWLALAGLLCILMVAATYWLLSRQQVEI